MFGTKKIKKSFYWEPFISINLTLPLYIDSYTDLTMSILTVDIGNTRIKWGVFEKNRLLQKIVSGFEDFEETAREINVKYPEIRLAMICVVGKFSQKSKQILQEYWKLFLVTPDFSFPFAISYETPQTLGADRLTLAAAAYQQFPQKNVLVIDAGTCITYDFIDAAGVYQGGAISPGLGLRYQSLNDYTQQLPLLQPAAPEHVIGKSTAGAIHSGVVYGVVHEIEGAIAHYQLFYKDLTVILTGGNADFLQDKLKNSIFANSNFLLEGLNFLSGFIECDDL